MHVVAGLVYRRAIARLAADARKKGLIDCRNINLDEFLNVLCFSQLLLIDRTTVLVLGNESIAATR